MISVIALASGCAVTPKSFTEAENQARSEEDLQKIYAVQDPITGPIDVYEAMARALRYNLEKRVALAEYAVANYQTDADLWEMVPSVETTAAINSRSNISASSSTSINTGLESLEPSTSTDQTFRTFNLRMAFNVLDFGVSYLQARQSGNRELIAKERQRISAQGIIRDVRSLYWTAVAAERVLGEIDNLQSIVLNALKTARQTSDQGLTTPIEALRYQKTLIDSMERLQRLRTGISAPKIELARMMNLRPDQRFSLVMPERDSLEVPVVNDSVAQLEARALTTRPELRESAYLERITADERRKTLVRLLPGIEVGPSYDSNSNSFLANQNWATYSATVTWNLVNLFSGPAQLNVAKANEEVVELQRLALTAAVITQVHVADAALKQAITAYELASQRNEVETQILRQIEATGPTEEGGELEVILARLDAGLASLNYDIAYAEVQSAYATMQQAIGIDQLPGSMPNDDVESIAAVLRQNEENNKLLELSGSLSSIEKAEGDTLQ